MQLGRHPGDRKLVVRKGHSRHGRCPDRRHPSRWVAVRRDPSRAPERCRPTPRRRRPDHPTALPSRSRCPRRSTSGTPAAELDPASPCGRRASGRSAAAVPVLVHRGRGPTGSRPRPARRRRYPRPPPAGRGPHRVHRRARPANTQRCITVLDWRQPRMFGRHTVIHHQHRHTGSRDVSANAGIVGRCGLGQAVNHPATVQVQRRTAGRSRGRHVPGQRQLGAVGSGDGERLCRQPSTAGRPAASISKNGAARSRRMATSPTAAVRPERRLPSAVAGKRGLGDPSTGPRQPTLALASHLSRTVRAPSSVNRPKSRSRAIPPSG